MFCYSPYYFIFIFSDKAYIIRDALIEKDLGITGDDGDEFFLAIQDEFGIDANLIGRALGLKDGQYLFHSEGSMFWLSDKFFKNGTIVPFTIGQLYDVVVKLAKEN